MRTMRWLASTAPMVMVVGLVVAACGGGAKSTATPLPTARPTAVQPTSTPLPTAAAPTATPRPTPTPTPVPPTPTAAPKFGGIYRTAVPSLGRLDLITRSGDVVNLTAVMNGFVQKDTLTDKLVPYLAESWTVKDDGLTYDLNIRQGVNWHDGRPLVMDDIMFTLNRIFFDEKTRSHLRPFFSKVKSAQPVDPKTVRITFSRLDPDFLEKFAQIHVEVYPSHIPIADFQKQPIGTGAFKWRGYKDGVSVELTKNPDYFLAPLPYLDGVTNFIIRDPAVLRSSFITGQLDSTDNATFDMTDQQAIDEVKRAIPRVQIDEYHSGIRHITYNQVAPWTDQRVRWAVHLALDREKFKQLARKGFGVTYQGLWVPERFGGKWGIPEEEVARWPGYRQPKDQDLAEARRLLKEAGLDPTTVKLPLLVRDRDIDQAITVADDLASIGFTGLTPKPYESVALGDELLKGNFSIALGGFGPFVELPEAYIPRFFIPGGDQNFGKWENKEISDLYAQQESLLDFAKRLAIVQEIHRKAFEWAILPITVGSIRIVAFQPYVRNVPFHLSNFFSDRYRYEKIWLDK